MKLWQAKAHAAQLWPDKKLAFRKVRGRCVILEKEEELEAAFGEGGNWLDAMRDAALRFTRCADVGELRRKAVAQWGGKDPEAAVPPPAAEVLEAAQRTAAKEAVFFVPPVLFEKALRADHDANAQAPKTDAEP